MLFRSENDFYDISLPSFWSSTNNIYITNTENKFSVKWYSCSTTLRITVLKSSQISYLNVSVSGLRIPIHGIDFSLFQAITISNRNEDGKIIKNNIRNEQLIPYFNISKLSFIPGKIGLNSGIKLSFQFSLLLAINDSIRFFLPNISVIGFAEKININENFAVSWVNDSSIFILTVKKTLPLFSVVTTLINGTFIIPYSGFSSLLFDTKNYSNTINNEQSTYIQSVSYLQKFVHYSSYLYVPTIGFTLGAVHYYYGNNPKSVKIRFQFQISNTITIGDFFIFHTPNILCPKGISAFGDIYFVKYISGDSGENNFISEFSAIYSNSNQSFVFTVLKNISMREINIFISYKNGFYFSKKYNENNKHYISASVFSLGNLNSKIIKS